MRITFTANQGSFEANEETLTCGVAGDGVWLIFQRDAEDAEEDWGIHLEYADQANCDYDCIAACRISGDLLSVDLGKPLGALAGVTGFDVLLQLDDKQTQAIVLGLRQIFRDHLDLFTSTI